MTDHEYYDANCRIAYYPLLSALEARLLESIRRDVIEPRNEVLPDSTIERIYRHFMIDAQCRSLKEQMASAKIRKSNVLLEPRGGDRTLDTVTAALELWNSIPDSPTFLNLMIPSVSSRHDLEGVLASQRPSGVWVRLADPATANAECLEVASICRSHQLRMAIEYPQTDDAAWTAKLLMSLFSSSAAELAGQGLLIAGSGVADHRFLRDVLRESANVSLDLSGIQRRASHIADARAWLAELAGGFTDRVMFGSGWPRHYFIGTQSRWVNLVRKDLGLDGATIDQILIHNYRRFFGDH